MTNTEKTVMKTMKSPDGTILHYVNINGKNVPHSEDGPALIPKGKKSAGEFYLFGVKYTEERWKSMVKNSDIKVSQTTQDAKRGR